MLTPLSRDMNPPRFPMGRPAWLVALFCALFMTATGRSQEPTAVSPEHAEQMKAGTKLFKEQVRPLLVTHCLQCHGGKSVKADFDLSTREKLMQSGVIEKKAADSHFFAVITHEAEPAMPFKLEKLPEKAIEVIGQWIDLGAPYDKDLTESAIDPAAAMRVSETDKQFWSFRPLATTVPPSVSDSQWCRTPIDRFVLARMTENQLTPNPLADRRKLVRRAYFDLLGLPPTPEQVEIFVNNPAPDAYEKLIDDLLQSPHYGERWARYWMDVARFAESHGYEQDYDRPNAYHYRDFLIRAFNDDLPYDEMVRWQLAGDEIAPDNPLALMATGFLGAGVFPTQLTEAEFESARYDELDDMTATTGVAFLGLSVGCARCHDHKYDPIPSLDYYRLASSFTSTIRSEIDLKLQSDAEPVKVQVTSEGFPHMKHHADDRGFPHFYEKTYVLKRGDVHQKDSEAEQGFLQVLMRGDKQPEYWQTEKPSDWTRTSYRRTNLARWITDTQAGAGHLTARVMVNRLWQHHFGQGIVTTPNDFGFQGERPSHPELLDWLAVDLVHNGWKLKRLHKLIMTSSVYMQSSDSDESRAGIDRENRYYWRFTPRRLEAEPIRDTMLSVSGLLDTTLYGPGTLDVSMRRRSLYFFIKRSQLIPSMMLFDWPEHLVSIGSRSTTTTAPQSLQMMNSTLGRDSARGFAKRLDAESEEKKISQAYLIAYARPAGEAETTSCARFLKEQGDRYREAGKEDADELALVDLCQTLLSMNEFVYID